MNKLIENARDELHKVEGTGINSSNLDVIYKLASITKNLMKIEEKEREEEEMYGEYRERGYGARDSRGRYREGGYNGDGYPDRYSGYNDSHGRERVPMREMYGHDRWSEQLDRFMDGADAYQYGRSRYRDSGDTGRLHEGLEKLMYGVCMLVESTMDFAETPEEKDIIRKHIQKLKTM